MPKKTCTPTRSRRRTYEASFAAMPIQSQRRQTNLVAQFIRRLFSGDRDPNRQPEQRPASQRRREYS